MGKDFLRIQMLVHRLEHDQLAGQSLGQEQGFTDHQIGTRFAKICWSCDPGLISRVLDFSIVFGPVATGFGPWISGHE